MIREAIKKISAQQNLSSAEMESVMLEIMTGKVETQEIVSFLTALNAKAETAEELAAAVKVMRRCVTRVQTKHEIILDTCGTGGDQKHTFNISTAVAFVASAAGVAVAKHGNRSVSSKSGSADVLEALGINIAMSKETAQKCLDEIGITFLFAPNYHPAMKYAMPARKKMAAKTIFNFLGPLSNPAGATHQLVGVYDSRWAQILATCLGQLDTKHALVVRGVDGLDELSTMDNTVVWEVRGSGVSKREINPQQLGFKKANLDDLSGGTAADNATILIDVLSKVQGPVRDIVILNAAAAIYTADRAASIEQGIELAKSSIDSGKALEKLELFRKLSQ